MAGAAMDIMMMASAMRMAAMGYPDQARTLNPRG
jgi:hypothetical protein